MNKSTFRKLIVVLCVAISILLVVCACGDGNDNPETTPAPETTVAPVETTAADTTAEDTTVADTTAEDTTVADTTAEDTTAEDTTAEDTTAEDTTAEDTTAEDTTAAEKYTYIVKVVDERGRNVQGATVQFCVGDICQLPETTNAFGTVMIELEKADYTVKVTLEGYSGEESYTFPEGSYTLNVTLTNLNPEPETTTAEPETTTAPETTKAPETTLEPDETFPPDAETEIVEQTVVLAKFTGTEAGVQNAVGARSYGMQFNVGNGELKRITLDKLATFADSVNTWTLKIWSWDTDYNTTIAGTVLYETTGSNHQDSTNFIVAIPDGIVIKGEVLVELTYDSGETAFTGWIGADPVAGYQCYLAGMSSLGENPVQPIAASIVVKKAVLVDPNAPVIPEFETAPFDKDYYGAKGAELFGFQWIQYLVDDVQMIQAWGYMGADEKSMVNFDGSPAEYDPYVIAEGSSTFGYYGWLGVADTQDNPGIFGYSIDGAEAVYNTAFTTSPHNQGVWDAGMNLDAVSVPDIRVTVPLTDLYGYHQIQIFYKSAAGVVVELDCILVFIEGEPEPVPGSEENPIFPEFTWNDEYTEATATVTAPVGTTYYAVYGGAGMALTINDGEPTILTANGIGRAPAVFSITNNGDAEAEYTLKLTYPVGSMMNPEVIEDMSYYCGEVSQAAGNSQGYYYTYTATADGTITLYFGYEGYPEGYTCDISLNNLTTSVYKTLLADGVDYYGLQVSVDVKAGDEIQIIIAAITDAEGNYYPAADMCWVGTFAAPAGTIDNPINIEWEWDDEYTNATATVTVPAGETVYFSGNAGMILTIDGVETAMDMDGVFSITNEGEEEATYALALATPAGAYNNPEIIENLPFEDEKSLEEGGSYNYIWTATEDVTVVLTITEGANITADLLTYFEDSEWPSTEQFELAVPDIDANWNYVGWIVADKLVIQMTAGQQLKIQVQGLTDWATWMAPAVDYTLTIDVEEASAPAPLYDKTYAEAQGTEIPGFQWVQYLIDNAQAYNAWGGDGKNVTTFAGVAVSSPIALPAGVSSFGYYGWIGVVDSAENPGMFGYSVDGAAIVYDAAFMTSPHNQGVWDAEMNLDAASVPDFRINADLTGLSGYVTVQYFYKTADGVVILLDTVDLYIPASAEYDKSYADAQGTEILGFQWVQYLIDNVQAYNAWGGDGKNVTTFAGAAVSSPIVLPAGVSSFGYYGWIGVVDSAENPGMFGYSIDGAEIVYEAAFMTSPHNQGVWDAQMNLDSASVPDFRINADLTGLSGYVTVQYFYKTADGVVILLDSVVLYVPASAEYDMTFAEALNTETFGIQWSQYKVDGAQAYQAWAGTAQNVTDLAQQPVATPLALAAGTQTFGYYGWIGVADNCLDEATRGVFGYAIDGGDIVYDATFIWINPETGTYEYNNEGALNGFLQGATTAPTYDIVADVSGLTGLHCVQSFYKTADGTVILLDSIMINIG